jgi:deoxyribose-phosphate aldolase
MDYHALSRNVPNQDYNTELAAMIDHTLLKADAVAPQIKELCQQACDYGFASVCVNPFWVPLAHQLLVATPVKICTVIGFPLGAINTASKAFEASAAIDAGASEVDMVLNVGALKSGEHGQVSADIAKVVQAARGMAIVKVILETCYLSDAEKVAACEIAKAAGADFVKTSTGFGPGGATVADITLMRRIVGPEMGVKASGGIRDYETAIAMARAGATRIGASASIAIVNREKTVPAKSAATY